MHFEHLIEINSALLTTTPAFTRDELWRGLMVRVFEPEAFPLGPDGCEWREDPQSGVIERSVRFGALQISDSVRLDPMRSIVFDAAARADMAPLRLTITVEEPVAGALLLRFVYQSLAAAPAEEAAYEAFRHSAWLENDRDMVRTLRLWLQQGRLAMA